MDVALVYNNAVYTVKFLIHGVNLAKQRFCQGSIWLELQGAGSVCAGVSYGQELKDQLIGLPILRRGKACLSWNSEKT